MMITRKWDGILAIGETEVQISNTKYKISVRRGKKTKGLRDMDFNIVYDDTFDYVPNYIYPFPNEDSERIQDILKKNGKVTWGDVYAPWLDNFYWRHWVRNKGYMMGEEILVLNTDPNTEMKCVLDVHFGDWYWIPKDK